MALTEIVRPDGFRVHFASGVNLHSKKVSVVHARNKTLLITTPVNQNGDACMASDLCTTCAMAVT